MDDEENLKGLIAWLGIVDPQSAEVRLTKKALAEAVERRGGAALPEKDARAIRGVTCLTRLDATVGERFAPEGKVRGVDVVEVAWADSLKDTAQFRRVAEWLGKALTLNPVAVAFVHLMDYCIDIRPAMIVPGRGVAVGAITSHCGIVSSLPAFWSNAAQQATTASAWANAALAYLQIEERIEAIDQEIAELNRQRDRARTDAERMEIHRLLKERADEKRSLQNDLLN